jgi:hypothetical protein
VLPESAGLDVCSPPLGPAWPDTPNHYLAMFDKGNAIGLYHTKRLASPGQRIVLYAKKCAGYTLWGGDACQQVQILSVTAIRGPTFGANQGSSCTPAVLCVTHGLLRRAAQSWVIFIMSSPPLVCWPTPLARSSGSSRSRNLQANRCRAAPGLGSQIMIVFLFRRVRSLNENNDVPSTNRDDTAQPQRFSCCIARRRSLRPPEGL